MCFVKCLHVLTSFVCSPYATSVGATQVRSSHGSCVLSSYDPFHSLSVLALYLFLLMYSIIFSILSLFAVSLLVDVLLSCDALHFLSLLSFSSLSLSLLSLFSLFSLSLSLSLSLICVVFQGPEAGQPEIACSSQTNGLITTGGGFST
jgi:hypothetical protein